jgi:hypothetical protein
MDVYRSIRRRAKLISSQRTNSRRSCVHELASAVEHSPGQNKTVNILKIQGFKGGSAVQARAENQRRALTMFTVTKSISSFTWIGLTASGLSGEKYVAAEHIPHIWHNYAGSVPP